ncbi:hypothetical protein TIFTF001_034065 [Ficus carica]|uniref:Uncharacterized protein n=1 Tax=Ficus carica TaxID=3494 RepID=A0AA88DZV6_FICCA|nr:hypothetical protein TIFTF001_034065 [Ficus carica]
MSQTFIVFLIDDARTVGSLESGNTIWLRCNIRPNVREALTADMGWAASWDGRSGGLLTRLAWRSCVHWDLECGGERESSDCEGRLHGSFVGREFY